MDSLAIINELELALTRGSLKRIERLKKRLQAEVERQRSRRDIVQSFEVTQRPAPRPHHDPVPSNDLCVGLSLSREPGQGELVLPRTVWRSILRLSEKGGWLPTGEDVTPYDCRFFAQALTKGAETWLPTPQADDDQASLLRIPKYRKLLDQVIGLALQGKGITARLRVERAM